MIHQNPEVKDFLLDPLLLDLSFTASSLSDHSDFISTPLPQEPFKFKLQIKTINDTSSQPSSLIVLEKKPNDIYEFKEKIHDNLDEKYGLMNYGKFKMVYKTENSHGAGNWLENEHEFSEFLDYCDKLKKATKMMLVIYCYVEGDRHLNLTVLHLKLWTTEIINIKNAADFDNLPSGPLFNMMNSVKVSKNAHLTSTIYSLTHSSQPSYTYPPSQLQSISTYPSPSPQLIPYLPPPSQPIPTYLPPSQSIFTYPPPVSQLTSIPYATYGERKYTQYLEILKIMILESYLTLKEAASKYA
ncbi:hypothetical protein C1645_878643 [Glomus cerebriforme]|uniref:Uncharacterized protein n=1 Tax=Glomus cerebriforme TaxID=658196 RepID=A0A397SNL7_9GLOM|nr:hypothetical protein C1645_878643 [Glomus cerebriforme]